MRVLCATLSLALLISLCMDASAQDIAPLVADTPDTKYFDFWEGTWRQMVNGRVDPNGTTFRVRRAIHRASFFEEWDMTVEGKRIRANALRAWEKTNNRWMYTWVSDNGLYQVWEGRKVGDDWYIFREFGASDQRYLSRQAWIPDGRDRLTRISERSEDGGKTWKLRFREEYTRKRQSANR